jgi:Tat protein secretion system quality control protein TatD with DNase activity
MGKLFAFNCFDGSRGAGRCSASRTNFRSPTGKAVDTVVRVKSAIAKGRQLVGRMPRERVLTETDGPFAQEGKRPLTPRDVRLAIVQLAKVWAISEGDVEMQLNANLKELLSRVPEPHPAS